MAVAEEEAGGIEGVGTDIGAVLVVGLARVAVVVVAVVAAGELGGVGTIVGDPRKTVVVEEKQVCDIGAAETVVVEVVVAIGEEGGSSTVGLAAGELVGLPGCHHRRPAGDGVEVEPLHRPPVVVAVAAGQSSDSFASDDPACFALGCPAGQPWLRCRRFYWTVDV